MKRKTSHPYSKDKKEALVLDYLNEQLYKIKDSKIDPKIICFTDVKLSPDYSYCDVYVDSRFRDQLDNIVNLLNQKAGVFRTYLAKNMTTYKVPIVRFNRDNVMDNVAKINEIFNDIKQKEEHDKNN
ncbi:30S ribosome-binding factor RbfA [bacterium]|nr:30S ribosome-binding factor RbfA [bacterium]